MKYQVGDEIIVLHTSEEGKVIEIINDKMVLIEVKGVRFPAYLDQIDFPYFFRFTKKKTVEEKKPAKVFIDNVPKEKINKTNTKIADGVWLSLIPKFTLDEFNDEVVELFKIHLINRTHNSFHFVYQQQFFSTTEFEIKNEILSFHDFYLHDISFADMNDSPSFHFTFSLLKEEKNKASFYEANVKLKGKQLFKRIEEMKEKNEPAIQLLLFEKYPDKIIEDKFEVSSLVAKGYKVYEANKIKQNLPPAREVVDLHMEKLSDNWQHMSNFEILNMQLSEFNKWYELAIAHQRQNLIVIHGVGSGKLKDEIHDILKTKKEVRYFINQYDHRFGYGATEIFFQY
ncbi:MAG: Smr/MutS family protein [Bacteroidetes bacterium]|nr:Smr/MutS family protein [Bacteroidota bacterium]MBS1670133.1 Smr/MutS family protein [Bacteroidota bacterium]